MTPVLAVEGMNKRFDALAVTCDVSLTLASGARTALIGPNGAGKTTLVNLISGALQPDSGEIHLYGERVTALSQAARVRRGLVRTFQINRPFKDLTVGDNIRISVLQRRRLGARFRLSRSEREGVESRVEAQLLTLGIAHLRDRKVGLLAAGEQRLVEIGIALAQDPRILLLDEPGAGVPKAESQAVLDAVDALPGDLAVLLIEHDMDLVFRFARRIVVLAAGAVLAAGTPAEIAADRQVQDIYFGRDHDRTS